MSEHKSSTVLMTSGVMWKHILKFSIPLMIGFLFQQLYTTVDSIVVGNVVGKASLAAVGSTTPIVNMVIGFFTGLASGAGVVIAKNFGAKNDKEVQKSVHTCVSIFLLLSVVATALGVFLVPFLLRLMKTPADVYGEALSYLTIYYYGCSFLIIYNMGSAILRAVGDSKRPLYYLVVSSVVNVIFDIIFVVNMGLGVEGAAYATILSEAVSALLVIISLSVSKESYRVYWTKLGIDGALLKEMFRIGMPSALQMCLTSFSNVFVQSYINVFGTTVMASWSCYIKIDQFVVIPVNSFAMAITTFVGQNLGAGEIERCKKCTFQTIIMGLVSTAVLVLMICIPAPYLVMLFNQEPDVIECGAFLLKLLVPFYLAWAITMTLAGALCGAGDTRMATAVKFFSFVIFRQIYLFVITKFTDSLFYVVIGYPIGWVLSAVILYIYYAKKFDEITLNFANATVNTP